MVLEAGIDRAVGCGVWSLPPDTPPFPERTMCGIRSSVGDGGGLRRQGAVTIPGNAGYVGCCRRCESNPHHHTVARFQVLLNQYNREQQGTSQNDSTAAVTET